jgi:hypothetical protein
MGPGEGLDRAGEVAVTSDLTVWLCRSVRARSPSTFASPGSDFAPEVECRVRYFAVDAGLTANT